MLFLCPLWVQARSCCSFFLLCSPHKQIHSLPDLWCAIEHKSANTNKQHYCDSKYRSSVVLSPPFERDCRATWCMSAYLFIYLWWRVRERFMRRICRHTCRCLWICWWRASSIFSHMGAFEPGIWACSMCVWWRWQNSQQDSQYYDRYILNRFRKTIRLLVIMSGIIWHAIFSPAVFKIFDCTEQCICLWFKKHDNICILIVYIHFV